MVTSVPYESAVKVKAPTLAGVCMHSDGYEFEWYFEEPYKPRTRCDFCPEDAHFLRKRLIWKCPVCDLAFLKRVGLLNHEHRFY